MLDVMVHLICWFWYMLWTIGH